MPFRGTETAMCGQQGASISVKFKDLAEHGIHQINAISRRPNTLRPGEGAIDGFQVATGIVEDLNTGRNANTLITVIGHDHFFCLLIES